MNCTSILKSITFLLLLVRGGQQAWAQQSPTVTPTPPKGITNKGRKVGIWVYYGLTSTGQETVIQRYDYDNHKLIYFRPSALKTYLAELSPGDWKYVQPDQPPLFIGGEPILTTYISQVEYPAVAVAEHTQGRVVVNFRIDTLGRPSNYRLTQRVSNECDAEAMRVARSIPATWAPARVGSHAVAVEYELPFTFRLTAP